MASANKLQSGMERERERESEAKRREKRERRRETYRLNRFKSNYNTTLCGL